MQLVKNNGKIINFIGYYHVARHCHNYHMINSKRINLYCFYHVKIK